MPPQPPDGGVEKLVQPHEWLEADDDLDRIREQQEQMEREFQESKQKIVQEKQREDGKQGGPTTGLAGTGPGGLR